jgi:hypothetical protein
MKLPQSLSALGIALASLTAHAQEALPQFTSDGELLRPADIRRWVFVSSGLGMTYGPARPGPGQEPFFTNVLVNPSAYEEFQRSGRWPDGTIFILEVRQSMQQVSIDVGGRTQGERVALEASVKDSRRFPDGGWAYFSFADLSEAAAPLARSESCYGCHSANGAVEWTFTQFYPDLLDLARNLGTLRADYDPARELQ